MKKYLTLLLIVALLALFSGCKKDDDSGDNPPPPPDKKYDVEYKFEVNENHGNIKLIYYGHSLDKHETENPASPWQVSYPDFKQGDSVCFHFEIIPLANTQLVYSWEVNINGDGYTNGNNGSGNTQYLDSIPLVIGGWAFKIE
jgi:hypothetical protein